MKAFRKDAQLTVRMSREFRAKLKRGSKVMTLREREKVSASDLLVKLATPALDELLKSEQPEPATV